MDHPNTTINVEHAIVELQHGRPIMIFERGEGLIVQAVEGLDKERLDRFTTLTTAPRFVSLTKQRGQILYPHEEIKREIKISLDSLDIPSIRNLSALESFDESHVFPYVYAGKCSTTALQLAKLAEIIPALLVSPITTDIAGKENNIYSLSFSDIENYSKTIDRILTPIAKAPLTLLNAPEASITIFRAMPGSKTHYAITVGHPEGKTPLLRVHSSCFTGDLLGSLKCDCGDQLQESMRYMYDHGGGIILYMMQEGRGIGLLNKIRAYQLQSDGMDTVEANEFLGFGKDERPYLAAATMIKQLGYDSVKLMTNNPRKVKGLKEQGINVLKRVPLIITPHEHNDTYLGTKFSKLGHLKNE